MSETGQAATEVSRVHIEEIARQMRAAGFGVEELPGRDCVAFTCPPRSRLLFGAVIAGVVPDSFGMLIAARTEHVRGQEGTTLYFPGYETAPLPGAPWGDDPPGIAIAEHA